MLAVYEGLGQGKNGGVPGLGNRENQPASGDAAPGREPRTHPFRKGRGKGWGTPLAGGGKWLGQPPSLGRHALQESGRNRIRMDGTGSGNKGKRRRKYTVDKKYPIRMGLGSATGIPRRAGAIFRPFACIACLRLGSRLLV